MRRFIMAATSLVLSSSVVLAGCMSSPEDDVEEADQAVAQEKGAVGMPTQAEGWAQAKGTEGQVLPPVAELPQQEQKGIPALPFAGGCAQVPGYEVPIHQAPSFASPTYTAPSFGAPQYSAPQYNAPTYMAPRYQASAPVPTSQAPVYTAPSYAGPTFAAPIYQAPTYEAPSFPAPIYMTPNYQAPNALLPANPTAGCYGGFAGQGHSQLAPIGQAKSPCQQ